jgi:hypothetical protein
LSELWKEVKSLRKMVTALRDEVDEGFKKNRWEIRGLQDLLDNNWEEGSESESAEEVVDGMEEDKEVRELVEEKGKDVRKEGWKETRSNKSRRMGRWVGELVDDEE